MTNENLGWEDYAGNFHKFDEAGSMFGNFFKDEEAQDETPEEKRLRETRYDIRKFYAGKMEKVYVKTVKILENKLNYSSSKHLVMGLIGLLGDAAYTLWDPIKGLVNSPVAKMTFEEYTKKEGASIIDFLKKSSEQKISEAKKSLEDMTKTFAKVEKHIEELADYAHKNQKTVQEVLNTPKDYVKVIKKSYKSFEEYEKHYKDAFRTFDEFTAKLELAKTFPAGTIAKEMLEAKAPGPLTEIGVKPELISEVVQSYVNDAVLFLKTYVQEYKKETKKELALQRKAIKEL